MSARKTQATPENQAGAAGHADKQARPGNEAQPEQAVATGQEQPESGQSQSGLAESRPAEPPAAAPAEEARGARTLTGRVVSNKMQKTVAVEIERLIRHPTYGKYIRRTTRLLAHDESGSSREGDLVIIGPCRPMSRRKSWRLLEVVQKARS